MEIGKGGGGGAIPQLRRITIGPDGPRYLEEEQKQPILVPGGVGPAPAHLFRGDVEPSKPDQ